MQSFMFEFIQQTKEEIKPGKVLISSSELTSMTTRELDMLRIELNTAASANPELVFNVIDQAFGGLTIEWKFKKEEEKANATDAG
jgi:hypothetical protein